jgi:CubicO group peptidase (beta-lactamase class C family)
MICRDHSQARYLFRWVAMLGVAAVITLGLLPGSPVVARRVEQAGYAGKIDAFVQTQMEAYNIPGMAVAVVHGDEVAFIQGYGVANSNNDPVTPETPFLLASVSKSFTALGAMQLVDAGELDLDRHVSEYLPWFDVAGVGENEITVAQLVYQTSGFSEIDGVRANLRPDSPDGLEAGVRDLASVKLVFQPGTGWEYSNINYSVLALLIQELSGQSYEAYIQENIFQPLEMTHSYTSLASARAGKAASGYYPFFGIPVVVDNFIPYTSAATPAAGLWSSAADMSRYLIAQLGDGSALGLSAQDLAALHSPGTEIEPGYNYAIGWFHAPNFLDPAFLQTLNTDLQASDDLQVLWHEGDWLGYKSVALLLPGLDYGVILLMNTNDNTITSVFKNIAWDVTLIANGGDAYYFQPSEGFFVRHSRWIFSGLALLLVGGLVWSARRLRLEEPKGIAWKNWLPLLLNLILLGYLYLVLLPDNGTDLRTLLRFVPDLGILLVLVTMFSVGWITASVLGIVNAGSSNTVG